MTESNGVLGTGAFGPEPPHDERLGALLREVVGDAPYAAVNWSALGDRIGDRVAAQIIGPWWNHAARWERRAIPLALAAGLVAAIALWTSSVPPRTAQLTSASGVTTAVLGGTSAEDGASQFARSVTNTAELRAGVPE